MTEQLILEKLNKLEQHAEKSDIKMDRIEQAVSLIAVQAERLNNLSSQMHNVQSSHDMAFGHGGIISEIKSFQSGCPRDYIKITLDRQWVVLGIMATMISGTLLKAFNVF